MSKGPRKTVKVKFATYISDGMDGNVGTFLYKSLGLAQAASDKDFAEFGQRLGSDVEEHEIEVDCETGEVVSGAKTMVDEDSQIEGKTFVLTGTLSSYTRAEAEKRILAAGGFVASSVTSKVDYVVEGESPGTKLDRAKALEITILDEESFCEMLPEESD